MLSLQRIRHIISFEGLVSIVGEKREIRTTLDVSDAKALTPT
jgi:hypothetical protein